MGAAEYARLEKTLLARGLPPIELERARATALQSEGNIASALVARRSLSEDDVMAAMAETFRAPKWDGRIDVEAARTLGGEFCWEKFVVPVERSGSRLVVAVADPTNLELHTELRFMTGARVIDVVVGVEPALARALRGLFPLTLSAELRAEVSKYLPLVNEAWETRLRERWVEAPLLPSVPAQLHCLLLRAFARRELVELRFELGPVKQILGKTESSGWGPVAQHSGVTLSDGVMLEMASHFTFMSNLPLGLAAGAGIVRVKTSACWHGGKQSAFDVSVEATIGGPVLAVTEAITRPGRNEMSADQTASEAALTRGRAAIGQGRYADGHRELKIAMDRARRVDGAVGYCSSAVLWALQWVYRLEGRVAEAAQAIGQAGACTDVPPIGRAYAHLSAAEATGLLDQHVHSAAHARAALELALDVLGSPGHLATAAAFRLGRALLAMGSTVEAGELAASAAAWGAMLGGQSRVFSGWLQALVMKDQGDLAGAEAKLRAVATILETDGDEEGELIVVLLDLFEVVAPRKADALEVLERALKGVEGPPTEPYRQRVERELARLRGSR